MTHPCDNLRLGGKLLDSGNESGITLTNVLECDLVKDNCCRVISQVITFMFFNFFLL